MYFIFNIFVIYIYNISLSFKTSEKKCGLSLHHLFVSLKRQISSTQSAEETEIREEGSDHRRLHSRDC